MNSSPICVRLRIEVTCMPMTLSIYFCNNFASTCRCKDTYNSFRANTWDAPINYIYVYTCMLQLNFQLGSCACSIGSQVRALVFSVLTWRPGFPSTIENSTVMWSWKVKLAPELSQSVARMTRHTTVHVA